MYTWIGRTRNKVFLPENISHDIYLASAGEIGGMMGKKFGFGWSRALPVILQKEDIATTNKFSRGLDPLPASRPLG